MKKLKIDEIIMNNLIHIKNIIIVLTTVGIWFGVTNAIGSIFEEHSKEEVRLLKENKTNWKFNIGDIVKLKSGSPKMTIKDTITEIVVDKKLVKFLYKCTWYNENKAWYNNTYAIENFEQIELIKVN
ncbi:DUF2158 domain-containing protein [Tenacibaculum maritimum]|uniref:DUF2158 domain-containing protein n=1 Tax=Tenacibaculum maritimum TaxID=107401 RepID=UPI003876859A